MPTIDLTGLKTDLSSSQTNLTGLSSTFSSQSSGFSSNAIPEVGKISDLLPDVIKSLGRAISSIGTSISGESVTALPKMESMLKGLVPDTSQLSNLCTAAVAKINAGAVPNVPVGLKDTIGNIQKENDKVKTSTNTCLGTFNSNNFKAPSEYDLLLKDVDSISTTMGDYSSNTGKYIFDPVGTGSAPHYSELAGKLQTDNLLTTANKIKDSNGGYAGGAITSSLYKASGIIKETVIRSMTKTSLYQKAELELGTSSDETSSEAGLTLNKIRGSTPEQNEGI